MDLGLKGSVALVTGSTRGLGKAIAVALAEEGASLILCGRDSRRLIQTEKEIAKLGVSVWAYPLDVSIPDSIDCLFQRVDEIGRLDTLVNNVGGVSPQFVTEFTELTDEDWEKAFQFNFMSMVRFTKRAIPFLLKSENASIVNIAAPPVKQPGVSNPHYVAAKTAMVNLSKYLANSYASRGIRVNAVCPGSLEGEVWEESMKTESLRRGVSFEHVDKEKRVQIAAKVPLGRLCRPEEIATYVAFLCSKHASFITGTCVSIDGGMTRSIF